jgi:peroxiredoxin
MHKAMRLSATLCLYASLLLIARSAALHSQEKGPIWSNQEKPIADRIAKLRETPDEQRGSTTNALAVEIRRLPATPNKLALADHLAMLSTEGDFGHDMLQEVATMLAATLHEMPVPGRPQGRIPHPYIELAQLVSYERVQAQLDDPQFAAALAKMHADDARREKADFALQGLDGTPRKLRELTGKVVLLNFWATWCPPCRKEMPDLESLYRQFKDQGLVILAISDENAAKVQPFIAERHITYPVLLDPGRQVNELFQIEGIPKTFVYDRAGKLVAQSIDMRTRRQFLEMLAQAGLH